MNAAAHARPWMAAVLVAAGLYIIAGGGLVGNALGIALAQGGIKVTVIDPLPRAQQDLQTPPAAGTRAWAGRSRRGPDGQP